MKRMAMILLCLMLVPCAVGCTLANGQSDDARRPVTDGTQPLLGGWHKAEDETVSAALAEKLQQAVAGRTDIALRPISLLETQVVSGVNYKILCEMTTPGGAAPTMQTVILYVNALGVPTVTSITPAP